MAFPKTGNYNLKLVSFSMVVIYIKIARDP